MDITVPGIIIWSNVSERRREEALCRPPIPVGDFQQTVGNIISAVRTDGDQALRELGEEYDGVILEQFEVSADEWAEAESLVDPLVLQAMDEAISRIRDFHIAGKPVSLNMETAPGLRCEARYLPISRWPVCARRVSPADFHRDHAGDSGTDCRL